MDSLLFGHNPDERIVAIRQLNERTMRVFHRAAGGISHEDLPFFPFLFLADDAPLEGLPHRHWVKRLEGDAFFRYLCVFEGWPHMWDAIRHVVDRYQRESSSRVSSYTELGTLHVIPDPVSQFLMQTGRTLFKGMMPADLVRMQLDIETYTTPPHRFSNARRPGDRIILIALSDSSGWEHMINGKELDERSMLEELVRLVRERDPDVLEGHNIFGFDLPYLLTRAELHKVPLAVGRDGGVPQSFESRTSFAERSFDTTFTEVPGRHVLDTLLLVQSYDAVKRTMESHGLKAAARHFGLSAPNRTLIAGEAISSAWDHDIATLIRYALDDVREVRALSDRLSGSAFFLTQMLPFSYGTVARMGSAAKIEALLVREYLRSRHSLPRAAGGVPTPGGYTDVFQTGVLGPVLHVDIESLYPSLMLSSRIAPASDRLGVFLRLLQSLTTLRLDTKRTMNETVDPAERSRLDALQSSFKILINSFYGYLGYSRALFNDFHQAALITRSGQDLLRRMIAFIAGEGGTVIEVDTDGIFFVPPPDVTGEHSEDRFVSRLGDTLPAGIVVVLDGRYRKMLSYKKKNYALLDQNGTVIIKGSSLISRSLERFGREYLRRSIGFLLHGDVEALHKLYLETASAIRERHLKVQDFARTETLRDSLEEYRRLVDSGKRNRSAAYEAAIAQGIPIRPDTRVAYYITGNDPAPREFENCRLAAEWDPNFPDENVPFYIRRLDEFSAKFRDFFEPRHFRSIFSVDDLFPFTGEGITVITRSVFETQIREVSTEREDDEGGDGGI